MAYQQSLPRGRKGYQKRWPPSCHLALEDSRLKGEAETKRASSHSEKAAISGAQAHVLSDNQSGNSEELANSKEKNVPFKYSPCD